MCGIAGIVDYRSPGNANAERVLAMQRRLRHRGPDGTGSYLGSHAALAHTRLALLDRVGSPQPMTSRDGRFTLIYNGEVYNYRELRDELQRDWDFQTHGDTEVVLAACAAWGVACLPRFNGMFAFFVWDEQRQRGFAARDGLGVKPFVYRWRDGELLFASEAKAILAAQPDRPRAHRPSILEYLTAPCFSGVAHSMFDGLDHLQPGHVLYVDAAGIRVKRWWDYRLEPRIKSDDGVLFALLSRAVARTLRADEPPGVFLSGGVDSTALAALAARHLGRSPLCYTIQFAEQGAFDYERSAIVLSDDLPFVDLATRELHLDCRRVVVERATLAHDLEELAVIDDALPAWEQELAQHHLARAAAQDGKAVLVGDAADETHYGYHFLLDEDAIRSPAAIVRRFAAPFMPADAVAPISAQYETLCGAAGHSWETPLARTLATTYLIVKRWLARLLHNGDIHTMAFSLEARVPFADRDLVELARRVHPASAFQDGDEKHLLRAALHGVIPEAIRRRKKSALPKDQRTETIYRQEAGRLLVEERDFLSAFFDVSAATALATSPRPLSEADRAALFRVICLAHWRRHYGVAFS